ncbi:TPA: flagellar motor protein MotB [Pseudomonas aeruginosa]|uniref:OmpA/MotB family protein n=1 Tax=Pseudomonas TaxID=286 RepID=UPI0016584B29|nr:OmpA family protein [Pseudomonas aeruginosa]MBC9057419.1 OmpA family protein [Pseudomonas aeruginosa]MDY1474072.1 OmpA family protein [Pseudomonas aeruginosa]HCA5909181.1 OmpA family protein [Pseudomonas aeruginosa]HCA8020984.1 OmpA family protein [Pseudomonas aeruginosa]HCA8033117.1 OmpA family protein [Pseudomonas aeruginosa]
MKEKPNEWVSISDLMAGVMAVVMLLLVLSVLQNKFAALKREQEKAQGAQTEQQRVVDMLKSMRSTMDDEGESGLVSFDLTGSKITLRDRVFARGSACVTDEARHALSSLGPKIAEFVNGSAQAQVFVEGHTDNVQVSRPVTDYSKFCTVYDDNFTLSAARAREARKLLIALLDEQQAKRVIVAGFGDSQPLPGLEPGDEKNRRVEVQFLTRPAPRT